MICKLFLFSLRKALYIALLLVFSAQLNSQSRLDLTRVVFGKVKITSIKNHEILEYKLRGDHKYRKARIVHMQDSIIMLEGGGAIELKQLWAIKIGKGNHLTEAFQRYFVEAGILFFVLSTVNNLIIPTTPVITQQAVIISASLAATGFLIRQLGIRRLRITKNKNLRIVNVDFQNMNSK